MDNIEIETCIFCSKKITKNEGLRRIMCIHCMAKIVEKLNILPNEHYSEFIDFAYGAKDRLINGEDAGLIFKNVPEGFDEWLKKNSSKTGFGLSSD